MQLAKHSMKVTLNFIVKPPIKTIKDVGRIFSQTTTENCFSGLFGIQSLEYRRIFRSLVLLFRSIKKDSPRKLLSTIGWVPQLWFAGRGLPSRCNHKTSSQHHGCSMHSFSHVSIVTMHLEEFSSWKVWGSRRAIYASSIVVLLLSRYTCFVLWFLEESRHCKPRQRPNGAGAKHYLSIGSRYNTLKR